MNGLLGWEKPRISKPRSALRVLFDCRGSGGDPRCGGFRLPRPRGRSAIRSGVGGREMWVWIGFWELGLFGTPVWQI